MYKGSYTNSARSLINPPTYIEYKNARFLIVDAPSNNNLPLYLTVRCIILDSLIFPLISQCVHTFQEFQRWNVTDVVRCCYATYSADMLVEKGIQVHDWVFGDGEPPPAHIVDAWLNLIDERFNQKNTDSEQQSPVPCIATHCVAGLGR